MDLEAHSIARWWNEFMLEAMRTDFPDPTRNARNLYHVSAALWDAYWAYEFEGWSQASPVFHREDVNASWGNARIANQKEAMSHAAYTVLKQRYRNSPGADRSLFDFRWLMEAYGFNPENEGREGSSPSSVGNRIGSAILEQNYDDRANELNGYKDTTGYAAVNEPLIVAFSGTEVNDINRWQPLAFDFAIPQNGIPVPLLVQSFVGVNWRDVDTFAIEKSSPTTIALDPGGPPLFENETKEIFRNEVAEVILYSSYLDPSDSEIIDISPGAILNNTLGTNDGTGRAINPATGEAYAPNLVKRADYGRILAEFWADGPASETPPGHWNTLHNEVSEHPLFERRYMGSGPELSQLEWDVRAYLALNGGMHDAAVAAWTLKRQYDYSRPIAMIRHLGANGQSSDPQSPGYSPDGLPLIPGLIELISEESSAPGERHDHLATHIDKVAIRTWTGIPADPRIDPPKVDWILPRQWTPYQESTFVTPAFAAYVSGHSTFSRTAAEIMTLLTGSPFFPGGMGEFFFPQNDYLLFEEGPSEDVTLQWATYLDATDQAGVSRLYGGIHVPADDFVGRRLGARVGVEAFLKAHSLRNEGTGTGWLRSATVNASNSANRAASLVLFDVVGDPLPVRRVEPLDAIGINAPDAILLEISDPDQEPNSHRFSVASISERIRGVEAIGQIADEETLSAEIDLDSFEPTLILICARSFGKGSATLKVYQQSEGEWNFLRENSDWKADDLASLSQTLLLRRGENAQLTDGDAALAMTLENGSYRFVLTKAGPTGETRLGVFGQ